METKRNDVQRWLQQPSGSLKPAMDRASFNKHWLDGFSLAYGQNPQVSPQQQRLNLDVINQILTADRKATLNTAAQQVVDTLKSELGKRMPVKDMLHLPAAQVADNLASQYAGTQASGILAALTSPPGPGDDWPAGVPNSRQLRQDIRTWHTASRIEQALSQRRYNDCVQHALRGSLDTDGVLDAIVEQRLRDAGITLKPDTPLTINVKAESWLTNLLKGTPMMRVSPNQREMTVTPKELVLGTWRPAFMAKLGIMYPLTSPFAHHTPTVERAQVKSDNPAAPGAGTVLTAGQIERLTADITPADFALDTLALYLNPDVRNSVAQSKIEKGSLAADRLLDDIQGGEITRTADDPTFEKTIRQLTAFRNGDAVPHAVMMAKAREGTLPIKDLVCLPLSEDRVALLSQRTGEYLLTTPQALQSGEMTDLMKDNTKDTSLVKLLVEHMDTRQSFDCIVRHGNQMESYLNKTLNLAKFRHTQQPGSLSASAQWSQMVAWERGAIVDAFKQDLRAAYQNHSDYQQTLRPIIENLDRSPRDFARAIPLYSPLHPLEGIEVRMAALSGEAKAQPQATTVADNLLWDVITLGRGVDHHTGSGEELSREQWKATREFVFSTAVAVAAGVATGGAGAALGLSKGAIFIATVAVQAGLTGVEESIRADLEVNEQQRDAAKDSVKYAVLLSIVGDGVMDKLAPAAWKLLKRAWKAGASADILRSMASKFTAATSDMAPLAKNWAKSSPADKNALIADTVMGTQAAQHSGRPESEIRQQIETTLAQYRQSQAIDKQIFHDELMLAWDCLDRSRTPGNHLAPYTPQHQAPASTAYRTPQSQLGEKNLYRLSDDTAIKDIDAGSDANYDRLWQQAENQAEAYRRLYGSESAQALRYYENGQQKISIKQPLPPGDTLGALLDNGDNLAKALALADTLKPPAAAGVNPVDTLTRDLVNALVDKGIDCSTITRNSIRYDRTSNTLSLASMDNVTLVPPGTVSPASAARMRGQIRELLENFPPAAKAQRNLALQGGGNTDLDIRSKYDNHVKMLKVSTKFSQPFNDGVAQFKRENTLEHLAGKLPHNYQMMKDTQLMNEVFTGNPLKLTPHELGEVSEYISLARKQAEIQEVALNAMTLAYRLTPETTRLSLHPQTLLTEAAGKGSRGRCRPLAYAMEVAIHNGRSEQMLENLGRVRAQVDLGAGRRYIEALDAFHDQNLEAIETAVSVGSRASLSVSEIVGQLKKEPGAASFSLRTEIHAMSVGGSVKDNGAKRYHFYDPNIGLVEYSSPEALGKGLEKPSAIRNWPRFTAPTTGAINSTGWMSPRWRRRQ
ncbi:hypothetical protein OB934_22470 [Aeromonas salmonicida]|uniref:hypothetical protein n=1 Tax=Aeromonas salmonicida TaxID=645 RepID=UPI00259FDA47|nr:hypothetical protein [Aeromonas salmonicida]MDM5065523.1 hypothetical protein [Aeromonas salmonicida]